MSLALTLPEIVTVPLVPEKTASLLVPDEGQVVPAPVQLFVAVSQVSLVVEPFQV